MGDADGIELSAASLRASAGDLKAFVPVFAEKLETALPERVRVERRRAGFLSGPKVVSRLECELGERRYVLESTPGAWHASRSTVVRGIALKSDALPFDQWLDELLAELQSEARSSEEWSRVLGQLLVG